MSQPDRMPPLTVDYAERVLDYLIQTGVLEVVSRPKHAKPAVRQPEPQALPHAS